MVTASKNEIRLFSDSLLREKFPQGRPGAVAIVISKGQVLLIGTYGMRDLDGKKPMSSSTIFRLGSLSKQFTAAAIIQLAENKTLSLDTPVAAILNLTSAAFQEVKILHLLSHTSGLPPYLVQGRKRGLVHRNLDSQALLRLIDEEPMVAPPGKLWLYSDLGYVLLGLVVEAVSRKPLADYAKANLFMPLGMDRTAYRSTWEDSDIAAKDYELVGQHYERGHNSIPRRPLGDGAVTSTAEDIARWHLGLSSGEIISPWLLEIAESAVRLEDGRLAPYGYGWAVNELHRFKIVEHGGNIAGFRSHFLKVPEIGLFVAIMTNVNDERTPPSYLALEIASFALGRPLAHQVVGFPESILMRYVGSYRTRSQILRTITFEKGVLFIERAGGRKYELYPIGDSTFVLKDSLTKVEFAMGRDNLATQLTVFRRYGEPQVAVRQTESRAPELLPTASRNHYRLSPRE